MNELAGEFLQQALMAAALLGIGGLVVCSVLFRRAVNRAKQVRAEFEKEKELVGILERELRTERTTNRAPDDRRTHLLELLPRAANEIAGAENHGQLGMLLGRAVARVFDPEQWMVFMAVDRGSKEFLLVAAGSTIGETWEEGACLNDQMGRLGLAIRRRATMTREDFAGEPAIVAEQIAQTEPASFVVDLAAPIVVGDRVAGVVSIGGPTVPLDSARDAAGMLAACAAIAVQYVDARRRALQLENSDKLTGLFNRNWFTAQADELLYANRQMRHPISIVMFSIDDLKGYANRQGPAVTDKMVRGVSDQIRLLFRDGDMLARWNENEFVALLPAVSGRRAIAMMDRLRRAVSGRAWPGVEHQPAGVLTLSGGLALYGEQGETLEELLEVAHRNLVTSQQAGGDRTSSDSATTVAALAEKQTALPPVSAVARDAGAAPRTLPRPETALPSLAPAAPDDDDDDEFVSIDEAPAPARAPVSGPLEPHPLPTRGLPPMAPADDDGPDEPGLPPQPPLF